MEGPGFPTPTRLSAIQDSANISCTRAIPISQAEDITYMTSECKGGGKFVGRWHVSVRNTASCPVCRSPQPVKPYGGRYKIADHREPEGDNGAPRIHKS
jgi:hypothetical protein